jgi:hypothetical protein
VKLAATLSLRSSEKLGHTELLKVGRGWAAARATRQEPKRMERSGDMVGGVGGVSSEAAEAAEIVKGREE